MIPQPVIITDADLIDHTGGPILTNNMFETDSNGLPRPWFTVSEVGKFFFGNTVDWMRWRIQTKMFAGGGDDNTCRHGEKVDSGHLDSKGKKIMVMSYWIDRKTNKCKKCGAFDHGDRLRTVKGARVYTLADVEQMAHALASTGGIDAAHLTAISKLVAGVAKVYRII